MLFNVDKVLFLGDVLIIGMFFKCLNYNQEEWELVIIVMFYLVKLMVCNVLIDKMLLGQSGGQDCDIVGDVVWWLFVLGVVDLVIMFGFLK